MMKTIDLRNKSESDLKAELITLRDELFRLKFQQAIGQIGNHRRSRAIRRDIARILTVAQEREMNVE